jgi:hypothetical protein
MIHLPYATVSWYWIPFGLVGWTIALAFLIPVACDRWGWWVFEWQRLAGTLNDIERILKKDNALNPIELQIALQLQVMGLALNASWVKWLRYKWNGMPSMRRCLSRLRQLLEEAEKQPQYDGWRYATMRRDRIDRVFFLERLGFISRCDISLMLEAVEGWASGPSSDDMAM